MHLWQAWNSVSTSLSSLLEKPECYDSKAWASKPSLKFVFKTVVSDFWECVEKGPIRWLTPFFHDHIHPVSFLGTVTFNNV